MRFVWNSGSHILAAKVCDFVVSLTTECLKLVGISWLEPCKTGWGFVRRGCN
jgi:hypothetical protein